MNQESGSQTRVATYRVGAGTLRLCFGDFAEGVEGRPHVGVSAQQSICELDEGIVWTEHLLSETLERSLGFARELVRIVLGGILRLH
jgi:hypothetical protein